MLHNIKLDRWQLPAHGIWFVAIVLNAGLGAILLLPHPWSDAVLLVAVAAGIGLAVLELEKIWLAWFIVFPMEHLSSELFNIHGLTVSRIFVVGLCLVVLVRYRDSRALRALVTSNGFRFFALFVIANLLAAGFTREAQPLFSALTYVEPLLFFALTYYVVQQDRGIAPKLLRAMLVCGALFAMVGLYEMATQQSVAALLNSELASIQDQYMFQVWSDRFGLGGRISSLIGQPVVASLYFAFLPILGLYYFIAYKRSRWIAAPFGMVCVLMVLATGTRGGLVALAAGLLVLLVFGLRRWKERLVSSLVMAGVVAGFLVALPNLGTYLARSVDIASGSAESRNVYGRIVLTRELFRFFQNHWFLGYGPGRFQKQAQAGIIPTVEGVRSLAGIENQYAAILVDGGVVAGMAYLVFICGVALDIVRMMRQPRWRAMGLTLFALFAAYFVFAGTEMSLTFVPNLLLMAVYGAFAAEFEFTSASRHSGAEAGMHRFQGSRAQSDPGKSRVAQ